MGYTALNTVTRDVRPTPLLVDFCGHPYVDVRASLASFIPADIPENLASKLLDFNLTYLIDNPELHDKVEFDVVPTCLSFGFDQWENRLRDYGNFNNSEIDCLRSSLRRITSNAFHRCTSDLSLVNQLSTRFDLLLEQNDLDPLERVRISLEDSKRFGTLPFSHLARSGFIAITLLRQAVACGIISSAARDSFLSTVRTVSHRFTADALDTASGSLSKDDFIKRYGHLRPGTYEITSPRYDHDPSHYLWPVVEHAKKAKPLKDHSSLWKNEREKFFQALKTIGLPSDPEIVESFLIQSI